MPDRSPQLAAALLFVALLPGPALAAQEPTRAEVLRALRRAAGFFREQVAVEGGYVWTYGSGLASRRGEAVVGPTTAWVQPPGTPAVGAAFLNAYEATGDRYYLDAAQEVAAALVKGQLQSGGWHYRIEFDPADRRAWSYRVPPAKGAPRIRPDPDDPGGWETWRRRQYPSNQTILDDDTTPSALRFLMQLDATLEFGDEPIHEAVGYALASLLRAQHPIGAWSHNYDRFPPRPPDPEHYPILRASYPESWSRTWTKDFTGGYAINDAITPNVIVTMLEAYGVYGDRTYLDSARRGGEFLILAQMPDPQPAWAQQYDRRMHPVWDRKFEPPAITGHESQAVLETLLRLYHATGESRFLGPIPKALQYLKQSRLPDGRLARFYELETNRPLYFTRDYQLTYRGDTTPTHYGFAFDSRLDAIEADYDQLLQADPNDRNPSPQPVTPTKDLTEQVAAILAAMDPRGAWVVPKKDRIESQDFIDNVTTLCRYLRASP